MNLTSELYGLRRSGISHGDVFTSPLVVGFMLDLMGYTSDKDLSAFRVLEPSFGHGDFLIEIQRRLITSATLYHFDATEVMARNIYGCEIDKTKYNCCIESLQVAMPEYKPRNFKNQDFLTSKWDVQFDFIVGNPPYIRYENIPAAMRNRYKNLFSVFHYRPDLYVLFYEHCLNYLAAAGHHCFICSNRWLKNEYGKKLRKLISTSYQLENVINVENLEVFKESVLAYPTITLISNSGRQQDTKIASIDTIADLKLPLTGTLKPITDVESWDDLFFTTEVENLSTIEQQGFNIGIGVATGADKIFISKELKGNVEEELLLPIVNARDLTGNSFNSKGLYLLNPYSAEGKLIDLNAYPKAKCYLEQYKSILQERHIVKNGRVWYSLIDKVKPQLVHQPKILLPDISGNRVIFIDKGSFYPAHNIYYINGKPLEELELLAAILMSNFVRAQVESVANKMNGGLPRWQSQNIRKLRLPMIAHITDPQRQALIHAYRMRDFAKIDLLVDEILTLQPQIVAPAKNGGIPQSIFDYDFSRN